MYKDYYEVDVTFDFYNDGPTETILLGFPVEGHFQDIPSAREEANLDNHKLYINGDLLAEYTINETDSTNEQKIQQTGIFIFILVLILTIGFFAIMIIYSVKRKKIKYGN
jgi:hypothetical protein